MIDLKFSKSHEWVKQSGDAAIIGITDYAQRQLGDVVFIELPEVCKKIEQSTQLGTIESTKAASEIYMPVSGQIIAVNEELIDNPQWINESPYEQGWLAKVKLDSPGQLDSLMDSVAYQEFVNKESH